MNERTSGNMNVIMSVFLMTAHEIYWFSFSVIKGLFVAYTMEVYATVIET